MEYYLARIKIAKIEFTALIKAKSFLEAQNIAERNYTLEDGYTFTIQKTLQ
jgi:hypothetical protein